MTTGSLDPVQRARLQERRERLRFLGWVLALVALLVILRILAGPGCGC
jgi:hypothetical protein